MPMAGHGYFCYLYSTIRRGTNMIKALASAIEKVRALPPERQVDAADALERIVAASGPTYLLSDEERARVEEGLADLDAGNIVPDEEMAKFWARHGT
jgi:predicted transcriptional regulator